MVQEVKGQVAVFEVRLVAVDMPTTRRRWNGGPMASEKADDALLKAVDAFQDVIRAEGFELVRTGYGVTAEEWGA